MLAVNLEKQKAGWWACERAVPWVVLLDYAMVAMLAVESDVTKGWPMATV